MFWSFLILSLFSSFTNIFVDSWANREDGNKRWYARAAASYVPPQKGLCGSKDLRKTSNFRLSKTFTATLKKMEQTKNWSPSLL